MRTSKLFLLAAGLCLTAVAGAVAQNDTPPAPTPPLPTPGPAPYSLDMPDLRPDNPNASLFPTTPSPSPGPGGTPGVVNGLNHGHGGQGGGGGRKRGGMGRGQSTELGDSDPLEVRVSYRRAKTLAMERDPGLAVLLQQADAAGTDVQKRVYLREYYTRLFAAVKKIDPSPGMKAHVALLQLVAEQRYDPKRRVLPGEVDLINGRGGRRRRNR